MTPCLREVASRLIEDGFFNALLEKLAGPDLRGCLMDLLAKRLAVS